MLRALPTFSMAPSVDERAPSPLPPLGHDISRPSSTSTLSDVRHPQQQQQYAHGQNSLNISLPGLSALASVASAPLEHLRSFNGIIGPNVSYSAASPTPTSVSGQGNNPPVCQNCTTSTTPLWRRDEVGSVLCNACGLFLKLHGRPRPISLKTDVIKSRNRVKSAAQGQKKKSLFDSNGVRIPRSEAGTPPPGHQTHRRVSQKNSSGDSDRSHSPISRTNTPCVQHPSNIAPQHIFDHAPLSDHPFNHSPSLPALNLRQPSPGSTTPLNDRHLELPQSYEALQQSNTSLKTRVSELEVINELYRGRVQQLEQNDRRQEMIHTQLRQALEQSQQRESDLKRRFDDLEHEVADLHELDLPHTKKPRMAEPSEYPDPPQPIAAALQPACFGDS